MQESSKIYDSILCQVTSGQVQSDDVILHFIILNFIKPRPVKFDRKMPCGIAYPSRVGTACGTSSPLEVVDAQKQKIYIRGIVPQFLRYGFSSFFIKFIRNKLSFLHSVPSNPEPKVVAAALPLPQHMR